MFRPQELKTNIDDVIDAYQEKKVILQPRLINIMNLINHSTVSVIEKIAFIFYSKNSFDKVSITDHYHNATETVRLLYCVMDCFWLTLINYKM